MTKGRGVGLTQVEEDPYLRDLVLDSCWGRRVSCHIFNIAASVLICRLERVDMEALTERQVAQDARPLVIDGAYGSGMMLPRYCLVLIVLVLRIWNTYKG